MTGWKYIGWDDSNGIPHVVVFDPTLTHAHMVPRHVVPKSAGFVTATAESNDGIEWRTGFQLTGYSDSLNLRPRPKDADAFDISK